MKLKSKFIFTLTALFIVTSCGGGGGGGESPVQLIAATISSLATSNSSTEVGTSVELSWSSSNASSCSASGSWSGSKPTSGSESVEISTPGDSTFSLTCIGEGGNASRSITVEGYRNIIGITVDGYFRGINFYRHR